MPSFEGLKQQPPLSARVRGRRPDLCDASAQYQALSFFLPFLHHPPHLAIAARASTAAHASIKSHKERKARRARSAVLEEDAMTFRDLAHFAQSRDAKLDRAVATWVIAAMIAVLFAGSTLLTPLYVI